MGLAVVFVTLMIAHVISLSMAKRRNKTVGWYITVGCLTHLLLMVVAGLASWFFGWRWFS